MTTRVQRVPRLRLCWFAVILAAAATARSALAQRVTASTLVASVAADSAGVPLAGAEVVIMDSRQTARADWLGEATITRVPVGVHTVRVRAFGYAPIELPVVFDHDTVPLIAFLKRPSAALDTVKVTAAAVPIQFREFEHRRAMGLGRFLSEQQLDSAGTEDFQTLLTTRIPVLRLATIIDPKFGPIQVLTSTRASCGMDQGRTLGKYSSGVSGSASQSSCFSGLPCVIPILLDGMDVAGDYNLLRTWDAAGVEYYSGAQVPVQYRTSGTACGLALVWSKR